MRRTAIISTFIAGWLLCATAWACDDHVGECEVEDWRWYSAIAGMVIVEGVTTCDKGKIRFRLYEGTGDNRKFLGTDSGYIGGHAFKAVVMKIGKPKNLSIKYSIEPARGIRG